MISSAKNERELKQVLGLNTVPPNAHATTGFGDCLERTSPDRATYQRRFPWRNDAGTIERRSMLFSGGERPRRNRGTRLNLPRSPTTEPVPGGGYADVERPGDSRPPISDYEAMKVAKMIAIRYKAIREVGLELQFSPSSALCSWAPSVRRQKPNAKRDQAGVDWNWCFWSYLRRYFAVPGMREAFMGTSLVFLDDHGLGVAQMFFS